MGFSPQVERCRRWCFLDKAAVKLYVTLRSGRPLFLCSSSFRHPFYIRWRGRCGWSCADGQDRLEIIPCFCRCICSLSERSFFFLSSRLFTPAPFLLRLESSLARLTHDLNYRWDDVARCTRSSRSAKTHRASWERRHTFPLRLIVSQIHRGITWIILLI